MQVLLVAQPNGWGGTEINSILMAESLGARGHRVDLWELPTAGSSHYSSHWNNPYGAIEEFAAADAEGLRAAGWWKSRLASQRPDLIALAKGYVHTCLPGLDLAARRAGIPLVAIEHEPPFPPADLARVGPLTFLVEWVNAGYRRLQFQQRLAADRISVSAITDRTLNAYLRWTRPHRTVIHPGIPFDELSPDPEGARRVRALHGIPERAMVFGAIGRLHPKKRFVKALQLFAQVEFPEEAWYLLVGGGEERAAIDRTIQELGIGNRVRIAEWVSGSERRAYFSAIDCFVMLSSIEGLGMTLVEALACGCRCISTACGGPEEVLTDPSLGLLVKDGDWGAVTAAMANEALEKRRGPAPEAALARRALVRREYDAVTQNTRYAEYLEAVHARVRRGAGSR